MLVLHALSTGTPRAASSPDDAVPGANCSTDWVIFNYESTSLVGDDAWMDGCPWLRFGVPTVSLIFATLLLLARAVVLIGMMPFVALGGAILAKVTGVMSGRMGEALSTASSYAQQILSQIRTVSGPRCCHSC